MKILLLGVMGILFCLHATAQTNAIGHTEKEVTDYLASQPTHEILVARKVYRKGTVSLQYQNDELIPRAYFFRNDTCFQYICSGFLSMLPKFIEAIKPNYKKISDNEWIDNTYTYKVTLTTDDKNFFAVVVKM